VGKYDGENQEKSMRRVEAARIRGTYVANFAISLW
jgi:hypothetical protein